LIGIGLFLVLGVGLILPSLFAVIEVVGTLTSSVNTPRYFWHLYGADVNMLESLSREYGVKVEDFPKFGRRPFPINYIKHRVGWVDDFTQRPVVYRRDVDPLIKGFASRCQFGNTIALYLFYSNRLSPRDIFGRDTGALVMEVRYKLDPTVDEIRDDQLLEDITHEDVGDDSRWVWENVAPKCTPPARTQ
jgi:hypothetical protein